MKRVIMSKVFVKDLVHGAVYTFNYWILPYGGLVQYIGPYQEEFTNGKTWKAHRFLWIKKPKNYGKDQPVVSLYGDNIRGTLGHYNEKR